MKKNSNKCLQIKLTSIFFCVPFCHHIIFVAAESTTRYDPLGKIALNCGSSRNSTDSSGRKWTSDTIFFNLQHNASILSNANQPPNKLDHVPYRTARLSISQFTYSFSVTSGPKFIRLHFYPASYSNFHTLNAYFSVKAGRYTLLSNFSSILHARALREEGFFKEYCLNVEDDQMVLHITFIPTSGMPDAYAFINGIEIVSMPDNLLYSAADDLGFPTVGPLNTSMRIEKNIALQLMHRINVGGNSISPKHDTGMFRNWLDDIRYLTVQKQSPWAYNNVTQLRYNILTRYAAPDEVYNTARMMGQEKKRNENYNLTWQFPVDANFIYLVRLYFCEFYPPITQNSDRVFVIYIANQTAKDHADVIEWSGGNGVPVYKDFAVRMESKGSENVRNLSIALHPQREGITRYSDAILNGLEIFKLSVEDNLAGPNPDKPITDPPTSGKNKGTKTGAIIGGAVSGFAVLSLIFVFVFRRRQKDKKTDSPDGGKWMGQFSVSLGKSSKSQSSTLPSDLCRRFSLAEIKEATNNFDSVFIVGVGGFGNVYKGIINNGVIAVAIKRLNPRSEQGAHEFKTEIEILSQLRYLHLVSLIGYCYEDGEMILVYDYMARGTLRDHLNMTNNPPLSWKQRLEICIGAARGLQYLHSGARTTIIHRDVKTTNILLDEKWVAKVSDFGLSKICPNNMSKPHVSTTVKGSFGYLDPEYFLLQRLTEKSDVYSFGVVLCEILSTRPPVIQSTGDEVAVSLADWARQCYHNGTFSDIVDPYLQGEITPDCLRKFSEVAVCCLLRKGMNRPSMIDVVWGLEYALRLQETDINQGKFQTQVDIDMENLPKGSLVDDINDDWISSGSEIAIRSKRGDEQRFS